MKITSTSNPKIKRVVELSKRKARQEHGLTVVNGLREVVRAHEAGVQFEEIYLCLKLLRDFSGQQAIDEAYSWGVKIYEVSESVFEKICFGARTEGIVALIHTPTVKDFWETGLDNKICVVLDHVEKPGNFGAILRTCDGAGIGVVIVADTEVDIFSPNVIRASTGIVFSMNMIQASPLKVKDFLHENNVTIVAADPDAKQIYFSTDLTGAVAFVFGAEDKGLSDFWLKESDVRVSIPMKGKADSLNVSNTAAILVYEALRQRH